MVFTNKKEKVSTSRVIIITPSQYSPKWKLSYNRSVLIILLGVKKDFQCL